MSMPDQVRAISEESARFAAAVPDDLDARVPSCPAWDARALVMHLGDVQRLWALVLGAGGRRPEDVDLPDPPPGRAGLLGWFADSTAELVAALGRVAPTDPAWTWWGHPATAGAIARHQVQEAAVHRVDAELVTGLATPLAAAVANDGVGEFLEVMLGEVDIRAVRLQATDTGSAWTVGAAGAGVGPGPVATVIGTASDLVLMLYGRIPLGDLTVSGDRTAADAVTTAAAAAAASR